MIKEEKKWLNECLDAFNSLRQLCLDFDDNLLGDAYLERKITILFPIFNQIQPFNVSIGYQKNNTKELYMFITFTKNNKNMVLDWFKTSYFNNYNIFEEDDVIGLKYCFTDIVKSIEQEQIKKIKQELGESNETFDL